MLFSTLSFLALSAIVDAQASYGGAPQQKARGFNYGAKYWQPYGPIRSLENWKQDFTAAQNLGGTQAFPLTSARLYTMIQPDPANPGATEPIAALEAAVATQTTLLLGMWASVSNTLFQLELEALDKAVQRDTTGALVKLIVGISVGNEDLYRNTLPAGSPNGVGAPLGDLQKAIRQVRDRLDSYGGAWKDIPVGHVDTWQMYSTPDGSALIQDLDWIGVNAFPYYQGDAETKADGGNAISQAGYLFDKAIRNVTSVAQGKEIYITETGWPVSGDQIDQAVAGHDQAQSYWKQVACCLFTGDKANQYHTWWFEHVDGLETLTQEQLESMKLEKSPPWFHVAKNATANTPVYDLTCPPSSA